MEEEEENKLVPVCVGVCWIAFFLRRQTLILAGLMKLNISIFIYFYFFISYPCVCYDDENIRTIIRRYVRNIQVTAVHNKYMGKNIENGYIFVCTHTANSAMVTCPSIIGY